MSDLILQNEEPSPLMIYRKGSLVVSPENAFRRATAAFCQKLKLDRILWGPDGKFDTLTFCMECLSRKELAFDNSWIWWR